MTPERFEQIEVLYHAALERQPAERGAFLAEACRGNEELRREVETLLGSGDSLLTFSRASVQRNLYRIPIP